MAAPKSPQSPVLAHLVERIRHSIGRRRRDGLASVTDVATTLDLSPPRLSDYLTGRVPMSDAMILRLCARARISDTKATQAVLEYRREHLLALGKEGHKLPLPERRRAIQAYYAQQQAKSGSRDLSNAELARLIADGDD